MGEDAAKNGHSYPHPPAWPKHSGAAKARPSAFAKATADKSATLSHPTRRAVAPSQRVGEGRGEGSPITHINRTRRAKLPLSDRTPCGSTILVIGKLNWGGAAAALRILSRSGRRGFLHSGAFIGGAAVWSESLYDQ